MNKGVLQLKRKEVRFGSAFCSMNSDLEGLEKQLYQLHHDEYSYYKSLKHDVRKTSYLLGRIAAKHAVLELLNDHQDINTFVIEFGVFEFPVVKHLSSQNIQVSISHCDNGGVAIAFPEEHPMGIDMQQIDDTKATAMRTLVVERENGLIKACSLGPVIGATLVWTIKEALSKVLRTGFTSDLKIYEIDSLKKEGESYVSTFSFFFQYKAISKEIGNYVYSIVLPKNTDCDLKSFWEALERPHVNT